jgi:integrase
MFTWAAKPGRELGVKFNPVHNLEALDKEKPRERILSAAEIKTLWWGLDHPNVPCSRQIALALKFELVTMLRSKEYLTAEPPEFLDLGNDNARFVIPMKRVKKRRTLIVPMSLLAQEIILLARASKGGSQPYVFPGKFDGKPLDDEALGHAVRGLTNRKTGKVVRRGICHFLGMAPWTPHDLRRTAATLAGDLGFSEARIAQCLDHRIQHGDDAVPTVTGVYVHSKRIIEKKEVLDAVAAELRRIIGLPPARQQPAQKLKLVG